MRQATEELEQREVVFRFIHPAVATGWNCQFENMVHAAMVEYMAARSGYAWGDGIDPQVSFTASNGVVVELDWPGKHQIRYPLFHADEAIDSLLAGTNPEEHDEVMRLVEAEEREISNAKPNLMKRAARVIMDGVGKPAPDGDGMTFDAVIEHADGRKESMPVQVGQAMLDAKGIEGARDHVVRVLLARTEEAR